MKQWKLILARTFHPTMKQPLLITPGSDRKHNFYTLQPNFPASQQDHDIAATLGNQRWFSAILPFELHRAGLSEKLLLTSIAPAVWHTHESNPSGLGCSSHLRAVPGGKAGEVHFRSEVTTVPQKDGPTCDSHRKLLSIYPVWSLADQVLAQQEAAFPLHLRLFLAHP